LVVDPGAEALALFCHGHSLIMAPAHSQLAITVAPVLKTLRRVSIG
jgi:hypothetical protein